MPDYKTPDVYVEEISTLPPSIAEVSTAIPAFIGYTADDSLKLIPTRITTFLEYKTYFGGADAVGFTADINGTTISNVQVTDTRKHKLYYALDLYFQNGGADCYVVSLGKYPDTKSGDDFKAGIDALKTEDEPTLIILSEATTVNLAADYYTVCQHALQQCADLQDRFCIFDTLPDKAGFNSVQDFRTNIGMNNLSYGAAYYPYLNTSSNYVYDESKVSLSFYALTSPPGVKKVALADIKQDQTALYNAVKQELNKMRVVLPPASVMAGIYALTDRTRGVWKAPANVSINAIIGPSVKISSEGQENLNVDANSGKSINAIRSFVGKGTLVWGARTLAGNDNEWKYVPVRRLFIMIEESAKKASYFAVFEPNTAVTWLKVKGMIESFLYGLWQQGAMAGSTSKAAYYVNVGLGTTMTPQDILEGRMIVEIGIAAVRPAEFIILRFSHKLQEA